MRMIVAASAALFLATPVVAQTCRTDPVLETVFCDSSPSVLALTATSVSGSVSPTTSAPGTATLSLTGSTQLTLGTTLAASAPRLTLYLFQAGAGGNAVTFPPNVRWPDGTAPTFTKAAGTYDMVQLITLDGGLTWSGVLITSAGSF